MLVAEAELELGTPVSYFGPLLRVVQLPGLYTKYSKYGSNKKKTHPLMVWLKLQRGRESGCSAGFRARHLNVPFCLYLFSQMHKVGNTG